MKELAGRVAVVTGASREQGIGAAVCRALAGMGASIFFTHWTAFDAHTGFDIGSGPDALLAELRETVPAAARAMDLSEPGAAIRVMDAVQESLGVPSILVNNAAYWAPASFRDLTEEVLDQHLAVNARATTMLAVELVRRASPYGWGRIISLVSGQDHGGEVNNLPYGSSKGAVSAMTRYLALEAAPFGITVNALDPGPTDTGWMDEATKATVLEQSPSGRIGLPEDAARTVAFLASPAADWITGQVIRADGGFPG